MKPYDYYRLTNNYCLINGYKVILMAFVCLSVFLLPQQSKKNLNISLYVFIWSNKPVISLWLPSMATRTMCL